MTYETSDLDNFLDRIKFPVLEDKVRDGLDKDITLEEVQTALGHMQLGNAPGTGP